MKKYIIILLALAFCPTAKAQNDSLRQTIKPSEIQTEVFTPTADELWDKANTYYINGDYHKAIDAYQQLLKEGYVSTRLYYNIANAYFKDNRLGRAILYYNRALRLSPSNDDARYNLEVAEAQTKDKIEAIPEFFVKTWIRSLANLLDCTGWTLFSLVALALAFALALLYLLARRLALRKTGFYGVLICALLFVVSSAFAATERRALINNNEAVVMSSAVSVKSSPDRAATDLFILHEGTKVRIDSRLDDWREITIADGKKGWVESRQIENI